jgi:hypothetical protein
VNMHAPVHKINEFLTADDAVREAMFARARTTLATHGVRAFEMPKRATCYHEAGHAVIYAAHGIAVLSVKIKRVPRARLQGLPSDNYWCGETHADTGAWVVDEDSDPEFIAKQMHFQLAGVTSEALFAGEDFRAGSSIDEVVAAQAMASNLGLKTGLDPVQLLTQISLEVMTLLRANADAVHRVAKALGRDHRIRGQKFETLLSDVQRIRR